MVLGLGVSGLLVGVWGLGFCGLGVGFILVLAKCDWQNVADPSKEAIEDISIPLHDIINDMILSTAHSTLAHSLICGNERK